MLLDLNVQELSLFFGCILKVEAQYMACNVTYLQLRLIFIHLSRASLVTGPWDKDGQHQ